MNRIDVERGRYWDLPWSLVSSCSRCSPGCDNCWSLAMEKRFHKGVEGKIEVHPERLSIPLKRKKPTVYAVWNDLLHENVDRHFIEDAMTAMLNSPQHTFLILTKRPKRLEEINRMGHWPYSNVYLGLTVCNQQEADEKIPIFLKVPGKKFLSIEPMLGEIDLYESEAFTKEGFSHDAYPGGFESFTINHGLDCVILGGETGPKARPMNPAWVRSVRDQCDQAGVPFFLKHVSKKDGRILDGRTHDDLPWVKP